MAAARWRPARLFARGTVDPGEIEVQVLDSADAAVGRLVQHGGKGARTI
jgi:hypothetical protein